jgi:hypothetical protein
MEASSVPVSVKWGTQTYDVEIGGSETVEDFRVKLFSLTNVPPDRQKIMVREKKGKKHAYVLVCLKKWTKKTKKNKKKKVTVVFVRDSKEVL